MLLKIDVNAKDIVFQRGGRIIVKLHYYSAFATPAHLATVEGDTAEDFDKTPMAKTSKSIFVGQRGGLSLG